MFEQKSSILDFTALIVAANQSVYRALSHVEISEPKPSIAPQPAASVQKSVFPDFIICLEDILNENINKLKHEKELQLSDRNKHMSLSEIITAAVNEFYKSRGVPQDVSEEVRQRINVELKTIADENSSDQMWEDALLSLINEERGIKRSDNVADEPGMSVFGV